jgi:hypothetical protein
LHARRELNIQDRDDAGEPAEHADDPPDDFLAVEAASRQNNVTDAHDGEHREHDDQCDDSEEVVDAPEAREQRQRPPVKVVATAPAPARPKPRLTWRLGIA